MSRQFIIAVDNTATREQRDALTEYLRSQPFGWWHWIEHFWLIVDGGDGLTTGDLRDKVDDIMPGVTNLVIEVRGDSTWSGFGPPGEGDERGMFKWIRETWDEAG